MTKKLLDLKLKQELEQHNEEEIYSTCLEYLYLLPSQERLRFILEDTLDEDSKPRNMSKTTLKKVIKEIDINPFNTDFWNFVGLDEFVSRHFEFKEDITLDDFKSDDLQTLVSEVSTKITDQLTVYSIEFEYEVRDHEYFMSYIFFGPDGELHTLVYFDEQNGVEVDRFDLQDIIECYLESL